MSNSPLFRLPQAANAVASFRSRVRKLRAPLARIGGKLDPFRTPWVGEVLLKERLITENQLQKALERQQSLAQPIGLTIVEMGFAEEYEVLGAINKHYKIAAKALSENIAALIKSRVTFRKALGRLRTVIRFRLSVAVIGLTWVAMVALSLVVLRAHHAQLTEQAVRMGRLNLNFVAETAKGGLVNNDLLQLNHVVKAAALNEGVRYGIIVDKGGVVRAHSDPTLIGSLLDYEAPEGQGQREDGVAYYVYRDERGLDVLHLSRPVSFQDESLGRIHLGVSLDYIAERLKHEGVLLILLSLLIVAFGIVLAVSVGGNFLRPLSALLFVTQQQGRDERDYRVHIRNNHEFEDLVTSFDSISRELGQKLLMERSFGRYVNPHVLKMIMARPEEAWLGGTRNEATILFTDVRGFTGIVESREPEEIVQALNEYFTIATRAIVLQGGYVDKYIGDAVLGVFGVPAAHEDHAERAVKAAVSMQKELKRRARGNLNPLLLKVGIGINHGVVVAGSIGSEEKMEFAVIGDAVNVAARLNEMAQGGEIIVSESVVQQIPRHLMTLGDIQRKKFRGKSERTGAFKLLRTEF